MSIYDDMMCGCIPNSETPELTSEVNDMAVPWDGTDKPKILDWNTFSAYLEMAARTVPNKPWWETAVELSFFNPVELLVPSQGNIGSCAGVSYFDRCYIITLLHQIERGSEQQIEAVNALATWLISKGWSRRGGQSISAVVKEGLTTGVFPARFVGEYDPGWYDSAKAEAHIIDAEKRQMGACLVPDSVNKFEALDLALHAGYVVEIGNSIAVRGSEIDENGVAVAQLGGSWSHATMFSEWKEVNGKTYFRWENSHGMIYENRDSSPNFGCWMDENTARRFLNSSFCDLAIVTYVESPYDTSIIPTLLPEE